MVNHLQIKKKKIKLFVVQVDDAQLARAPCEKVIKHCFSVLDRNAKQVARNILGHLCSHSRHRNK